MEKDTKRTEPKIEDLQPKETTPEEQENVKGGDGLGIGRQQLKK